MVCVAYVTQNMGKTDIKLWLLECIAMLYELPKFTGTAPVPLEENYSSYLYGHEFTAVRIYCIASYTKTPSPAIFLLVSTYFKISDSPDFKYSGTPLIQSPTGHEHLAILMGWLY